MLQPLDDDRTAGKRRAIEEEKTGFLCFRVKSNWRRNEVPTLRGGYKRGDEKYLTQEAEFTGFYIIIKTNSHQKFESEQLFFIRPTFENLELGNY